MLISSGPATVIAHGEATTFFGAPLRVVVPLPEGPFALEWVFEDADTPSLASEDIDGGRRFLCSGLDDRPGRGTSEPVLVGQAMGDRLWVHFRASRWGRTGDRTVHWTMYRLPREHAEREEEG